MSNGQTVCGVNFGPLDNNVTNNIKKKNSIESILNAANHWYALSYYFYVLMVDIFFSVVLKVMRKFNSYKQ